MVGILSNCLLQTVVSLDLYLAYLRAAFHTCYYCAVVTDHLEELQRKCLKHVRKPLSKVLLEEVKASEAEKAEKIKEITDEEDGAEKEKEPVSEPIIKEKTKVNDVKDWKRNGVYLLFYCNAACLSIYR